MEHEEILKILKETLSEKRYAHTLGVADTSEKLAIAYDFDQKKAYLAGLLHDCGKYLSREDSINLLKDRGIELSSYEMGNPQLLHAKTGEILAREKFKVNDGEILSAIRYHTTGHPKMTLLEEIVFIADYIEPGRDKAPNLDKLRKLAYRDKDLCMHYILKDTLEYLKNRNIAIDPATQMTYDYYNVHHGEKMESKEKIKIIYEALSAKKSFDIKVIDIEEISSIADYFVIASVSNENQMLAAIDEVDEKVGKATGESPKSEGQKNSGWYLLDYGDVVVHLFREEDREFYDLEHIWSDGKEVEI